MCAVRSMYQRAVFQTCVKPRCCHNQMLNRDPLDVQCSASPLSSSHRGKQLNTDLRDQGCAVWDTELHRIQGFPIEVLLQAPCNHMTWESVHMFSSVCRAIYLFATTLFHIKVREKAQQKPKLSFFLKPGPLRRAGSPSKKDGSPDVSERKSLQSAPRC